MKKPKLSSLAVITALFAVFLLGFFAGRSGGRGDVILSLPASMETASAPSTVAPHTVASATEEALFPVNINTADLPQLMALPGIGEVLARRIIAYRETNGDFAAVTDLMKVEDIGEKRLEGILDLITVGD